MSRRQGRKDPRFHHLMNGLSAGCTAFLIGALLLAIALLAVSLKS